MAATDLYDLATELLDGANEALAGTDGGEIERAFVSLGLPAFDCCPQLTVHVPGPTIAATAPTGGLVEGQRPRLAAYVHVVPLIVTVIRCVTVYGGDAALPTADQLDADAEISYQDAWAIYNWIATRHTTGELFPSACRELFLDPVVPVRTEGGCGGFEIPIRVQLDGYRPEATA